MAPVERCGDAIWFGRHAARSGVCRRAELIARGWGKIKIAAQGNEVGCSLVPELRGTAFLVGAVVLPVVVDPARRWHDLDNELFLKGQPAAQTLGPPRVP